MEQDQAFQILLANGVRRVQSLTAELHELREALETFRPPPAPVEPEPAKPASGNGRAKVKQEDLK